MKTKSFAYGLISSCLLLLAACAGAPPSAEQQVIETGCPAVVPCSLPAAAPSNNGELLDDADVLEAAWAECAAQVDMVYQHQVQQTKP
ncbi:Rz1-like lysis system protein LysC [Pseudomonas kuykendallii]|uniref:Rz1-like lysis system protein LysC n=1 Tax=Pseudomonas kuykendallii TaxID=1007099 RepID=UPI001C311F48